MKSGTDYITTNIKKHRFFSLKTCDEMPTKIEIKPDPFPDGCVSWEQHSQWEIVILFYDENLRHLFSSKNFRDAVDVDVLPSICTDQNSPSIILICWRISSAEYVRRSASCTRKLLQRLSKVLVRLPSIQSGACNRTNDENNGHRKHSTWKQCYAEASSWEDSRSEEGATLRSEGGKQIIEREATDAHNFFATEPK